MFAFFIALILVFAAAFYFIKRANFARRERYLESYAFHKVIGNKLTQKYPHLTAKDQDLVLRGLRQYFLICLRANKKWVSMPSQVVDEAWHQFILSTRLYAIFCRRGFSYFLHHTPAEAMASPMLATVGIRRAWRLACALEGINPKTPSRLPLIFALDGMLDIPDGFKYSLQCEKDATGHDGAVYCASHIGCSSGCVGDFGSDSSFDSDSSGCGSDGGCSGGGCGGGD